LTALVFWFLIVTFLDVNKLTSIPQSTIITDRDGNELYRFFEEDRRRVEFDTISPYMIQAIVAVEDQTFRENN
jgi:membrane peptidoglycan carboxypeptidase